MSFFQQLHGKWLLFKEKVWITDSFQHSGSKGFLHSLIRIVFLAGQKFQSDKCLLHSSALTYYTFLSIVPVLAFMLSILKGLGVQERLEPIILEEVAIGSKELVSNIMRYIDNTNFSSLGVFGLLGLVLTCIILLGNVEGAFNEIWRVKKGRPFHRKFSDYLSVLLVGPIILLSIISLTTVFQSQMLVQKLLEIGIVNRIFFFMLKLTPLFFVWLLFFFINVFIPNTQVRWSSALWGSIIAGSFWQAAQWAYINFQFGITRYNAIYGAIAQLPILMIWLYLSWVIVLFGSEIAFAHQSLNTRVEKRGPEPSSYAFRELAALKVILAIGKNFFFEKGPMTLKDLSQELHVSSPLVEELIHSLVKRGLVSEALKEDNICYQPAKPLEKIGIKEVLDSIRRDSMPYPVQEKAAIGISPEEILTQIDSAIEEAIKDLTVKDLILPSQCSNS